MISFEIMIPVNYNDGRTIPDSVVQAILDMVGRTFGGFTLDTPSLGYWFDKGKIYREPMRRLTVACQQCRIQEGRAIAKRIGQQLGQVSVYFSVNTNIVEFI